MGNNVEILGVRIDSVYTREAVATALRLAAADRGSYIVTPNAEIVMASLKHPGLKQALAFADLSVGDGVGVLWASRFLGRPLPEKVNGIDLMLELLKEAGKRSLRVYLIGAREEVVAAAAKRIRTDMGVNVVGYHHGYFGSDDEADILLSIRESSPHIIFVGMGSPRQELWMHKCVGRIPRGVMMGVGGSLDVISGAKPRAPRTVQQLGLEWLYRLIREPWRARRMTALPRFVLAVVMAKLRGI